MFCEPFEAKCADCNNTFLKKSPKSTRCQSCQAVFALQYQNARTAAKKLGKSPVILVETKKTKPEAQEIEKAVVLPTLEPQPRPEAAELKAEKEVRNLNPFRLPPEQLESFFPYSDEDEEFIQNHEFRVMSDLLKELFAGSSG